jgi:hypothetical protein
MRNRLHQLSLLACLSCGIAAAGEGPFFITYTHQMEEPGNLEFANSSVTGAPSGGSAFIGSAAEFEYGLKGWWTTEAYLDGAFSSGQSTVFTGFRLENRFRVLPREHWINPVLYVEFEDINGADKSLLEVVGHDGVDDLKQPVADARQEKEREIEAKLILSSYAKGWTIAENLIAEKNLAHEPYEFGYSLGVSRPLALAARPRPCNFCPENLQAGLEMYGGLGTHADFGLHDTSHYLAPVLSWTLMNGTQLRIEPSFGLTDTSARFLLRFGISYEVAQFGRAARKMFTGGIR